MRLTEHNIRHHLINMVDTDMLPPCWLYPNAENRLVRIFGETMPTRLRRAVYHIYIGDPQPDHVVFMRCGVSDCLNPAHMRQASRADYLKARHAAKRLGRRW